ncbi:hypothetical protein BH18ACT1_BH18ACT1_02130 [soil metagenome]
MPDDVAADADVTAAQAARLVVQVLAPLGLDPADFDPDGDDGTTDLVGVLDAGRQPDGSYGFFNGTLYAVVAHPLLGRAVPADTIGLVRDAQRVDGSWNYLGDGDPKVAGDADTTALAVQALVAGGATPDDATVRRGLRFLARLVDPDGSVDGFSRVNSASVTALAVAAAGYDPDEPCWRHRVRDRAIGQPFTGTSDYLRTQAQENGSIADSPDGSVAFATAQAVQALSRRWLPVGRLARQCASSAQFLAQLDEDLFRSPPVVDRGAEVQALRGGVARRDLVRFVLGGSDYQRRTVRRFFRTYVERPPTREEAAPLRDLLAAGVSSSVVKAFVLGSDAYVAASGGQRDQPSAYLGSLYRDVLGRAPDPNVDSYAVELMNGTPPAFVAAALLQSTEGLRFTLRSLYGDTRADPYPGLLDRRPTQDERVRAVEVLGGGGTVEDALADLTGTVEYDLRARS